MSLRVQSAAEFPLTTLVDVFNRSFKGYIAGDVHLTPQTLAALLARDGVDLGLSLIALQDEQPIGFALIARRGAASRLAAFGIVPEAQQQGIGKHFMESVIQQARERADRAMTLEVFEQNVRALRLYQSLGFSPLRRLMGYEGSHLQGEAGELAIVDVTLMAKHYLSWQADDLPWQCSGEVMLKLGPPHAAYRMENCFALTSDPAAERIIIRGLAVPPERQRQKCATRLVAAIIAAHPGKNWYVPQICPEEYSNIFLANGFQILPLNQFQMELIL